MVEWCNNNSGFISAILALFSIILSVIAIYVSVIVARFPYKKKVVLSSYWCFSGFLSDNPFYLFEVQNIGNRTVRIVYLGIGYKEHFKWKLCHDLQGRNSVNKHLNINESIDITYSVEEYNQTVGDKKAYIIAKDSEGKLYRKRMNNKRGDI